MIGLVLITRHQVSYKNLGKKWKKLNCVNHIVLNNQLLDKLSVLEI